jgi:hypothetical protein
VRRKKRQKRKCRGEKKSARLARLSYGDERKCAPDRIVLCEPFPHRRSPHPLLRPSSLNRCTVEEENPAKVSENERPEGRDRAVGVQRVSGLSFGASEKGESSPENEEGANGERQRRRPEEDAKGLQSSVAGDYERYEAVQQAREGVRGRETESGMWGR